ncbi:MAG: IS1634 family transposase [Deltaproteobacteria bacterium]|nr:IS1634 family transposase [Deltaproteobacteria bacterium]
MSYIRKVKVNDRTYLAEVKCERINGKPVQKFIRYIGKEVDGKQILSASISDIEIDSVKIYGPLIVLDYLAKEIGLDQILGSYSNELLSMVYAHCIEPRSINQMTNWFKKTDLNHILQLDHLTEQKLLSALDSIEQTGHDDLQVKIFNAVQRKYRLKMSSVFYDVTNTYLYSKKCPLGKLGHSKAGKDGLPLVQIGLAVTKEDGIPIFHTVYDGNIHDARTLHDGLSMFQKMKIKDIIVVYDRGITSEEGLEGLRRQQLDSLSGLPIKGTLKSLIRKLKAKKQMIRFENRIKTGKNIFYVVSQRYRIGTVGGKLLICYKNLRKQEIRESRYDEITHAEKQLRAGKRIKGGLEKYFNRNHQLNKTLLGEAEEFDGYSCLFCTKEMSKELIIKRYFEKDLVEKAFRNLNGIISLRPIRHWLYDRVVGHIFICYLAYLLLTLLEYKLEKAGLELSASEAMRELETMYKVYMRDTKKGFELDRVVRLSKVQENILKSIDKNLLKV